MILTSPLRRVNSTLERVANISIYDICTRWSVFSGTVTYSPVSGRGSLRALCAAGGRRTGWIDEYYYRRVPPECPPSFIRPPPPIFPHRKNWYRECTPPRLSAPPFSERPLSRYLASDRVLLPIISHPTLPPCIMKFQNVRDISRGTWPTIYSLSLHARCSRHDHCSRPVGVAVVVRQ